MVSSFRIDDFSFRILLFTGTPINMSIWYPLTWHENVVVLYGPDVALHSSSENVNMREKKVTPICVVSIHDHRSALMASSRH